MTRKKAIEILILIEKGEASNEQDWINATKLGIEALTLVGLLRETQGELAIPLLYGETKD